jgi:hypothetical protein
MATARQNITGWAGHVGADVGGPRPAEGESAKDFGRTLRSAFAVLGRHARLAFEAREGRLQ